MGGIAVSIGARIGALAGPGGVLVSSTVRDLVAGSGLGLEDAGEHELKGVPDRWRIKSAEILGPMSGKKRVRFRPPGLKPTTKVGTLGPYRGRLGLAWVIAPIVASVVILAAGYFLLTR